MIWEDVKGFVPLALITFFWVCGILGLSFKSFRTYILESHKIKSEYSWTRMIGSFLILSGTLIIFIQMIIGDPINVALVTSMFGLALGVKLFHSSQNEKDNKKLKELKQKVETKIPNLKNIDLEDLDEEEKEKEII